VCVCDVETTKMRLPRPDLGCYAKGRKKEVKLRSFLTSVLDVSC
jgi:hypothetical protein